MIAEMFKQQRFEAGRRRGYKEGYALSRREGAQAVQKAWEDWNRRRETAQANGEPFTEPPPTLDAIQNGRHS